MTEGDHQTGDTIVQAKSLLKSIQTFEFIVLLKFWDSLLSQINRVNLALQDKKLDIARAAKMIKGLLSQLTIYRETFFTTILQSSIVTAEQLQVTPDFQDTRKRPKKMMPGEKAKDESPSISAQTHFKAGLIQVLDLMIAQMNTRFIALNEVADDFAFLSGQAIVNTSVTELTKIAADLAIKYPDDLDPHEFSSEIESFKFQATTLMSEATDMNHLNVLEKIFDLSLEDVYPNITTALRIFLCMPVTTATCERSFSKLKLIKSYLRSSLGQERLANISILSIEKDTTTRLNFDKIIDLFAEAKSRKVLF
ncbi:zinc finger MYM-type protein 1-like [Bactrocera neohumeralis]|uniref:zinc finger MYM-type protein 1-like n=1 Tax=Bactrocera neohumeralis TaxID=98809 RepID=UPI0021662552|nr:zinc finger MYM-type protein 1-like [Bactrocera neohumeralis]